MAHAYLNRTPLFAACFAVTLPLSAPASAFYCYVPSLKDGTPPLLRERPNDTARVIARMERGSMIRDVAQVRERNGWIYLRWYRSQMSGKVDARGWARHEDIHGGECED